MNYIKKSLLPIVLSFCFSINFINAQTLHPGDVDNNGIVNHIDMLYVGIANGSVGPPRVDMSGIFQPTGFTNWGTSFPDNGLDYAYADCNGDGIIDFDDQMIVEFNYGQVHGLVTPPNFLQGTPGTDPELFFDTTTLFPFFLESSNAAMSLSLGTDTQPATDFYGISFTVVFDPQVFQGLFFLNGGVGGSWIEDSGLIYTTQNFKDNNPLSGEWEITIVKTDQSAIPSGFGNIGLLFGIVEENVVALINPGGTTAESLLEIKDIRYITPQLNDLPIVNDTLPITILEFDSTSLSTTDLISDEITLYPNPVGNQLTIEAEGISIQQLIIYDNYERVLLERKNDIQVEKMNVSTSSIPNGFYFVKILTDKGIGVKKILISR